MCAYCVLNARVMVEGLPNSGAIAVCYGHALMLCEINGDNLGVRHFSTLARVITATLAGVGA